MRKFFLFLTISFLFAVSAYAQIDSTLALGNPSNAKTDLKQPDNYLVTHNGFTLSYNKTRGAANWVAWHLEKSNIGKAERTNDFAPDTTLPADWWIKPTDYTGSGYDRGHMCPSKDRSDTERNNRVTFLMSNMQPQAPKLNQKTWKYLEDYTREIVGKNNEAYIYAGCYGEKGRIKDKVTIPASCFKIIVVLPEGENDLKRVDKRARVIAVDMPNDESVSVRWRNYLTTVDEIEKKTGFDFLSNVSKKTQKAIESKIDNQSTETEKTEANPPSVKTDASGRKYYVGSRGGCYYLTASGKKSYVDKNFCENISAQSENEETAPPKNETKKPANKSDASDRKYFLGSRGGCYYLTASGNKKYVDKSFCAEITPAETEDDNKPKEEPETKPAQKADSSGRTYLKGSRGGCYYLSPSGKKVYVDKSLCN